MHSEAPGQAPKNPLRNSTNQKPGSKAYNTFEKERILRKTTTFEVIEREKPGKSFTTMLKRYVRRDCHTVRRRAITYITILREKYGIENEIPLERAKEIFREEMDLWDSKTIKAYFGTQPHRSEKIINRTAQYTTGTISQKKIRLTQDIPRRYGRLERMKLATIKKRGQTWFLVLNDEVLIAEIRVQHREGSKGSIDNFSPSPKKLGIVAGGGATENIEATINREQTTTLTDGERKRSSESIPSELTAREQMTLQSASEGDANG